MRNTEMIALAVAPYVGKVLTGKQVVALTLEKFPTANPGSILPSDHAGPNRSGIVYADQLFGREATGYRVLSAGEIVRKPRTGRTGESLADALKAAHALIAANESQE